MNIIILDVHHPEDGRINRHIKYMQSLGYSVFHININRYFSFLDTSKFSLFGETGLVVTVGDFSDSIFNRIKLLFKFISPLLALKIYQLYRKLLSDSSEFTIIHVHDYELLLTAQYLRVLLFGKTKIVYDRHEYLENLKGEHILFDRIPIIYERIAARWIDGLVDISESHLEKIKKFFPFSQKIVIPNYPDPSLIKFVGIEKKIENIDNDKISIVYFGSLDINLDRDISLTLEVIEALLRLNSNVLAYVGGNTSNHLILDKIKLLNDKYPDQF
jgi:hypothetical protein